MPRRTRAEIIAALQSIEEQTKQRRLQLQAKEKNASRKRDTRCKIVVGSTLLAHAEKDTAFAAVIARLLDALVTKPADRAAIDHLLPKHPDSHEPSQQPMPQPEPQADQYTQQPWGNG